MKNQDSSQGKPARKAAAAAIATGTPTAMVTISTVLTMPPPPVRPMTVLARSGFLALSTRPAAPGPQGVTATAAGAMQSGLATLANAAATVLSPILPARMSALAVSQPLHRLDANVHVATLERGVTAANRVGDALGAITMRMLVAPDDFEATPSATPPATEIQTERSQRLVLRDGALTFKDRGEGALRFFGAGRTYPSTVNGQPRLFFAGTGIVIEGAGSLKGTRGTLAMTGEITRGGEVSLTVIGRFDPDGPIVLEDNLSPMFDGAEADAGSVVMTLAGAMMPGAASEDLRGLRLGTDVPNAAHVRSLARVGNTVGRATGSIAFDASEHRYSVPLAGMYRVITFTDAAGRRLGSLSLDTVEGTSLREQHDSDLVQRTVAYGSIAGGTGVFTGASGVFTLDAAVPAGSAATSVYTLRLGDPDGRFRAVASDIYKPMPAMASGTPPPLPSDNLVFVDAYAAQVTEVDRNILRYAERTLADGMELARWWEQKDKVGDYAERFDVVREYNPSDRSFGFFDTAVIAGAGMPVMGIVQEMFYDRQKLATGETIRAQLQEFVLRYFMRVSHFRQPEAMPAGQRASHSMFQRAMSWLPEEEERRVGFGYQQLYYKEHATGKIGKFTKDQQNAVIDLRDVGPVYDWIVLKVDIFDFNLQFAPFGGSALKFQLPLKESTYLVLGPPFIKNTDNPEPGVLGQYGYGYAFVPYAPDGPGVIAYGPGHFAAAIQTVDFKIMQDGEIRVRAAFVVNRPNKIANVDIAPLDWGFQLADMMTFNMASKMMAPMRSMAQRLPLKVSGIDPIAAYIWMANTMTGGMAEQRFGISKTVLEKRMLVQHFMQHYEMLINSLLVWRTMPDWTAHDSLPDYCRTGIHVLTEK